MRDVFIEYIVRRKNTGKIIALKVAIAIAATLLSLLLFVFSGLLGSFAMVGSLLAFGALYGGYYLFTSQNVEFEYAVTNGEIDVDRIIAQRRRGRLVSTNCREAEAFGKYKAAEHAGKTYQTKIFACDDPASPDVWYLTARIKDKGLTLIVFNADERMINAIKPFLPRPVMHEAFKVGG